MLNKAKNDELSKLQLENIKLKRLASHDGLTGILNRRAVEKAIAETMQQGGILLVCDLDRFKSINDTYGHLVGDQCLQLTTELLRSSIRTNDILGRIGGDEFVIFAYGNHTEEIIQVLRNKIERNFQQYRENEHFPLSISIGGAVYHKGESYTSLFNRADQALLTIKAKKHEEPEKEEDVEIWIKNMEEIRSELIEEIERSGAYCQDYRSFKTIYRFLERCMKRDNRDISLVLLTLVDANGNRLAPFDKRQDMPLLGNVIQNYLRMGDVFTKYSSCQYLILLMDVTHDQSEMICKRIKDEFLEETKNQNLILHYCDKLQPTEIRKR